eukprot:m.176014 g.176014  ORF g.176014 m.176014 type:complete len:58 (+) comp9955_c0_seq15:1432-1605(+)
MGGASSTKRLQKQLLVGSRQHKLDVIKSAMGIFLANQHKSRIITEQVSWHEPCHDSI